jgi:hypothetical protein
MDGGCERHDQYCIGALVTISHIQRDNHHGPLPFAGRVNVKLHEPNLAAERKSFHIPVRRPHSGIRPLQTHPI